MNIHVHNEPTKNAANSNLAKQNIQGLNNLTIKIKLINIFVGLPSNSGSGRINEEIGQKCEDVKMEEINEQLNCAMGQPKGKLEFNFKKLIEIYLGKLLQQILHSKAQHSLPGKLF